MTEFYCGGVVAVVLVFLSMEIQKNPSGIEFRRYVSGFFFVGSSSTDPWVLHINLLGFETCLLRDQRRRGVSSLLLSRR